MWQFAEAVRGIADACVELDVPVTGGNVSFYNQTGETAILPTPVCGVLGVIDDVALRIPAGFAEVGDVILLLGDTREEFSGSEWAHVVHGHLGGRPPVVDLAAERALASVFAEAAAEGLITSAHDLSDGGLSQALVESCLRNGFGAAVALPGDPFVALFSESAARALVSVPPEVVETFEEICRDRGVAVSRLGLVGEAGSPLQIAGLPELTLADLRTAHTAPLPFL
jgi:phosphoribosylformylglycinamidine synthase